MVSQNIHEYYWTYDQRQRTSNLLTQNLAKLVITLIEKPFQKWGLYFIRLVKPVSRMLGNWYILIAIDYIIKWVEAWTFYANTIPVTTKFVYEHILTRFGCPFTIVTNQGTHFNNDVIKYFTNHFILRHTSFIFYYPQGNGQVESTNKVFGTLLTKWLMKI
jgi:hypothetical protein